MVKTSRNRNSVKIVLDFTDVSRLLVNNSAIPFLTAAEKRHFHSPKLPALRAEVDGRTQKSVRPFSCFFAAASKIARLCLFGHLACTCRKATFLSAVRSALGAFRNAPVQRRNVRSSGFRRVHARLCPESRTNCRHGRDRLGLALWLCVQSVFSIKSAYFLFAMSSSSFCICRS